MLLFNLIEINLEPFLKQSGLTYSTRLNPRSIVNVLLRPGKILHTNFRLLCSNERNVVNFRLY